MYDMFGEVKDGQIVAKAKKIFRRMDADRNKKVTITEFVDCCLKEDKICKFLMNET